MNGIGNSKLDLDDCISFMREKLEAETTIKEFDRQVFESIVDYVIGALSGKTMHCNEKF